MNPSSTRPFELLLFTTDLSMVRAAVAAGVDGIMVEVHPKPELALSDGPQALTFEMFEAMMGDVQKVASALSQPLG